MLPAASTLIFALLATQAAQTPQVSPASPKGYTQFVTKPDGTLEMSTAAQKFTKPGKPDIWLVGAIHIGQKDYYKSLQTLLDAQEAVFFEGVKPPAGAVATPAKPAEGEKPVVPTYQILSDALGLEFQLAVMNYKHANWTNVDLSIDELDKLNKAQANGKPTQFDQVKSFLDPNSGMAKQLSSAMQMATPGMKEAIKLMMVRVAGAENTPGLDPATEKIILDARNTAVVDALRKATADPAAPKSIAVFYGAKHMADLQSKLVSEFGYQLGEKRWYPAASADPKKVDPAGQQILNMIDQMLAPKKPAGSPKASLRRHLS